MIKSIFVCASEPYSGKTLVALGCAEEALRHTAKVALFKPIIRDKETGHRDRNIEVILHHHKLDQPYESTYALERSDAIDLMAKNKFDELMERVINKYKLLEENYDFVICEGTDYIGEGSEFELELNALIAQNLGSPVVVLGQGLGREIEQIVAPIQMAIQTFEDHHCQILGTIVNKVEPQRRVGLLQALKHTLQDKGGIISAIPKNQILRSPTVRDVVKELNAEILFGEDAIDALIYDFQTAAMGLENYFKRMTDKSLVITPGDRTDILMGVLQASISSHAPSVSGILLTGGLTPSADTMSVIQGLPSKIPILSVPEYTFETTVKASHVRPIIRKKDTQKTAISLALFEKHVESGQFFEKLSNLADTGMTPKMFLYHLRKQAKRDIKTIVLPESNDIRILQAAAILQKQQVVNLVLLGNEKNVKQLCATHHIEIQFELIKVIDPLTSPLRETYAQALFELRKHKGLTYEMALDAVTDVSYFGTMMVHLQDAHGMVSGAAHTTQHTIRPALQIIKTPPGIHTVSSIFFMLLDDRVVIYGDCAINPDPNAEQLAEIAIASADSSTAFGIAPKVAMLSYSSGSSGKGANVEKVRAATEIVKRQRPDILIEGPIQYDAAVDAGVGQKKLPNSPVAGKANVLVFPDLNTGNNTYKAVQRETGAIAVGPMLQGLNKPVNDLSRGCLVTDIVNTVIITAIQAQTN